VSSAAETISRTRTTDKRFYGVVPAIVTAVENDPEKEGRVKIQYPWFDDQMESDWVRVCQIYAGDGYGAFFLPEVGDEALVAFLHGDMRMPVVLGMLYNGLDKPPTSRTSGQDQKLIHTKGGHELLLDDSPGQKRIRLKTAGGHSADLSDQDRKITLQTSGGQTVVLDDSASTITVTTNGQSITVDGSGSTITLSAATVVVQATSIALGGSAAIHPLVLGDLFATFFDTHTHICTAPGSPSSPPVPLMTPELLALTSAVSRTV
jgi:uncharacterized protein involved in type VI secretion and phage assembly